MNDKKVVVFGGGTGISFLLRGLKKFPVDITAIITVADNGSSTGKLREEFLMPAMGDIRNVLINLSNENEKIKDLLRYRFDTYTDLDGHPIGNLMLVAMYNLTGSLKESIKTMSDFLKIPHKVLPLTEDNVNLMAETVNGDVIKGESEIGHDNRIFKRLFYDEEIHINTEVINEIETADLIILSIGSLYTSIIPNLLSKKIINAIDNSKARILYTCNAVDQSYETEDYTVSDHVKTLNSYLGKRKIDAVIAANSKLPKEITNKYISRENKKLVKIDKKEIENQNCKLIEKDLLVIEGNYIRHDEMKFATSIFNYLMEQ